MSDVVGSSCLCFQFATGTGKTTMAKEAVKAVQTLSGRSVIVLAPSSAAVETLKDSSFRAADTLANFQYKNYLQDRARGQILWIDEAGLLSARQMRWAIDFASRNACRVILSGDSTASLSRTWRCAADLGTRGRRKSGCLNEDIPATGPRAKGGDL
jgi:AAA domain